MSKESVEEDLDWDFILDKDLANIINKSTVTGQPLTARERSLIEEQRRKQLTEEAEEKKPVESAKEPKIQGLFKQGENRRPKDDRTGYEYAYIVYAEIYGKDERTIQRWVQHGRKKSDLPPFHDPHGMKRWWVKHKKQHVPDGILKACLKVGWEEETSNRDEPQSTVMELPTQKVPKNYDTEDSYALERLRKAEASAGKRLMDLMDKEVPDFTEINMAQKAFENAASLRAKYEPVYIKRMKENKELFTFKDLVEMGQELHIPIIEGIRGLKEEFYSQVGEKYEEEVRKAWEEKVEKGFILMLHEFYLKIASDD